MLKSKRTTKAQTTIPPPVRDALHLEVGDEIVYRIEGERVILTRASSASVDDPFALVVSCGGIGERGALL